MPRVVAPPGHAGGPAGAGRAAPAAPAAPDTPAADAAAGPRRARLAAPADRVEDALPSLIEAFEGHDDLVIDGTIDLLADLARRDARARADLIALLRDPTRDARLRGAAAVALGRIDDPEALAALVDAAGREPEETVRQVALMALGQARGAEPAGPFPDERRIEHDAGLRVEIGGAREAAAREALARAIRAGGTDAFVAIEALYRDARDPAVRDAAIEVATASRSPFFRRRAALLLGAADTGEEGARALADLAVRDAVPAVRDAAIESLGAYPRPAAARTLADVLATAADPKARSAAARSLGRIGSAATDAAVLDGARRALEAAAAADPDDAARAAAAGALQDIAIATAVRDDR